MLASTCLYSLYAWFWFVVVHTRYNVNVPMMFVQIPVVNASLVFVDVLQSPQQQSVLAIDFCLAHLFHLPPT